MKKNNIILDFTQGGAMETQELALVPAKIAKEVMKIWAATMGRVSSRQILRSHIDVLNNIKNGESEDKVKDAVQCSIDFANERQLVQNIVDEKWDLYSTGEDEESNEEAVESKLKVVGKIDLSAKSVELPSSDREPEHEYPS